MRKTLVTIAAIAAFATVSYAGIKYGASEILLVTIGATFSGIVAGFSFKKGDKNGR